MQKETVKPQRIAFWGTQASFDYHHIGGTNALCRRLAHQLSKLGHQISYVYFDSKETKVESIDGITIYHNRDYLLGLKCLEQAYDHIVSVYLPKTLRLNWCYWRYKRRGSTKYHAFVTGWPDNALKRISGHIERRILRPNGSLFCLSQRLYNKTRAFGDYRAKLLLPPVPDDFFISPKSRLQSKPLRINFMGRIDEGKGIKDVETFFTYVHQQRPDIKLGIYGYSWQQDNSAHEVNRRLEQNPAFHYEHCNYAAYSSQTDVSIHNHFQNTDILFLPYKTLSTTLDTPLVVLEGLAHLCPILGIAHGDLKHIYGHDKYFFDESATLDQRLDLLQRLEKNLDEERQRIHNHIENLRFRASLSAAHFLENL